MTVESTSLESNTATKSAGLDKNLDEHMDEQPTASFTGSSLHASIISPIHMSNLPLNILEHIQQHNGNVITSLPNNTISPEVLLHQQSSINHNNSGSGADTKKSDEKSKGLTPDERRQRRLLRNRLAAKDCRKKKKEYIKQMEERISQLESERIELKEKVDELKAKIASVPSAEQMMMNNDDNYKLMKEVEALNAKLGNMQ